MHDPPRILIVDDNEANRDILGNKQTTQNSAAARFAASQYRSAMKRAT
jgi:hypothetical protein